MTQRHLDAAGEHRPVVPVPAEAPASIGPVTRGEEGLSQYWSKQQERDFRTAAIQGSSYVETRSAVLMMSSTAIRMKLRRGADRAGGRRIPMRGGVTTRLPGPILPGPRRRARR